MGTQWRDTPPEIQEKVLEGLRQMSPGEKLNRVGELNRAVRAMAVAGIRQRHGSSLSDRELRFRLASLWLSRETMVDVFDWDPEEKGL